MKLTFEELHTAADLLDRAIAHGQLQIGVGRDYDTDGLPGQWESAVAPSDLAVFVDEDDGGLEIVAPEETDDLHAAARAVVDAWEGGDLAAAVRNLDKLTSTNDNQ